MAKRKKRSINLHFIPSILVKKIVYIYIYILLTGCFVLLSILIEHAPDSVVSKCIHTYEDYAGAGSVTLIPHSGSRGVNDERSARVTTLKTLARVQVGIDIRDFVHTLEPERQKQNYPRIHTRALLFQLNISTEFWRQTFSQ